MVSAIKSVYGYAKSCVLAPVQKIQKIGAGVNEVFWNQVDRVKALCTIDTLVGSAGSLLMVYGAQALQKDYLQQEYSSVSTGGALLTSAVGGMMVRQGVKSGRKEISNADRIISQKQQIAQLNRDMRLEPGAKNTETILIAIDPNDHNGALDVKRYIKGIKQWAGKYSIHAVMVERPECWDQACADIASQGKTVKHILVLAHGTADEGVKLGGKLVRDYVEKRGSTLQNVDRLLFWSCCAGIEDGEAQAISHHLPEWNVQAPYATAYAEKSFLTLDASEKPTILQFSKQGNVITQIFQSCRETEYPIENETMTIINALKSGDADAAGCLQKFNEQICLKSLQNPETANQCEKILSAIQDATPKRTAVQAETKKNGMKI